MRAKKSFDGYPAVHIATVPIPEVEGGAIIYLPKNPSAYRVLDLTPWLALGIDDWVWAYAGQLKAFLRSKSVTPSTVASFWKRGLTFFEFLVTTSTPCQPATIERSHIGIFVAWLNDHSEWKKSYKKHQYSTVKSVLVGLQQRGVITNRELFPLNPFPGSNASKRGQSPLSSGERVRFAEALRDYLVAIHKGQFTGTSSEVLTVHALALAFRTGLNTVPLLELRRDCLAPHPFMPNMMLVESFKRRGNATNLTSLRFSKEEERPCPIPMDGVALLRKVLELTQPLADRAPEDSKDRIWLYESEAQKNAGELTRLTTGRLVGLTQALVARRDLRDDGGEPLRINISRLRKTFENRLWALSNGDLIAVAAIMGHKPIVADNHYLACTQAMRENATFVGEALPDIYRNGPNGNATSKSIPVRLENTPVGRCKDSLNGDKAPKDGTACDDFFNCFTCRSYAVVGSAEDLHRLFSFYWFLERERDNARTNDWREQFRLTMQLIDTFTTDKFDSVLVVDAKERARVAPHVFWASYSIPLSAGTNDGNV